MNALGYRLPLICLVGMGLVGCSAAGDDAAQQRGSEDDQAGIEATMGASDSEPGETDAHSTGGSNWYTDQPIDDTPTAGKGSGAAGGGGKDNCDCGLDLPGITIDHDDDGITIIVDLPNDGAIVIETKEGTCKTSEGGLDITGDVTIDLGSGTDVPLLDAELHVGVGVGMPTIEGTADVDGSLLDGVTGGSTGDASVSVSLDPNVGQTMPESDAQALLDLELQLPSASIGCGSFPAMNGDLALVDANIEVKVDGCHKIVKVTADVAAGVGVPWASMVPLHAAAGALEAIATLNDGALVSLELDGDMAISDGAMRCGLTPLTGIALPNAKLVLDEQGAMLSAITTAALHPGFSLSGQAELNARFAQHDWSINLCGAAMVDLTLVSAKVATCLDLSAAGAKVCEKPASY
jgi:hypothetical protein